MNFPKELQDQIKNHIADRCGLYFRGHDLKNLESDVNQRMKALGLDSVHSYYLRLTISEEKEVEFRELLNLLTINRAYFFRHEPQFLAFKDKVLPVAKHLVMLMEGIFGLGRFFHEFPPGTCSWKKSSKRSFSTQVSDLVRGGYVDNEVSTSFRFTKYYLARIK